MERGADGEAAGPQPGRVILPQKVARATPFFHTSAAAALTAPLGRQHIAPRSNSGEGTVDSDLDLLQGTLDVLVLKTLSWGPRHGYAVARWIKDTSDGTIQVEDRALYLALHRLEERNWVESEWGLSSNNRRAKFYRLTAAGRRALREQSAGFASYAGAMLKILRVT